MVGVHVGLALHYGWAVAITASTDPAHHAHPAVVDRRRIELIEPGLPAAPIHHEGGAHDLHRRGPVLDDDALARLVEEVRASAWRTVTAELAALAADLPSPVASLSVPSWDERLPADIASLRRVPWESRADSAMYRQLAADAAAARGWQVHRYDPRRVEAQAAEILGASARDVLHGPRARLGPPWTKDHRTALAAAVLAAS